MNMNFAAINKEFLSLAQPSDGKNSLVSKMLPDNNTQGHPAFSTYLQKAKSFENVSGSQESAAALDLDLNLDPDKLEKFFSDHLAGETGHGFLLQLKQLFLKLANGDLKNISMDQEGLGILAKMLEKAGFAKQDLEDLMADLSETGSKIFSMDEIMNHLFTLPTDSMEDLKEEVLLESSAHPFVISLLQAFAIPEETINTIMSEADRPGDGISLDVIIEKLNTLAQESLQNQTLFQTTAKQNTIASVLDSLGMKLPQTNGAETSSIFLTDLTAALQAYKLEQIKTNTPSMGDVTQKQTEGSTQWDGTKSRDLLSSLFKYLTVQGQKSEVATAGISQTSLNQTSLNQTTINQASLNQTFMKNGIEAEFIPQLQQVEGSKSKLDPASLQTDIKSEAVLKEIQAVLSGKFGGGTENHTAFQEKNNKLIKPFSSQANEHSQVSGADVKDRDFLAGFDALKAKNSAKNLPAYVTHQVGKSLVRAINQGENRLTIQLKPPELGRLVMHIDSTGNSMKVSIMTENHAAREMLAANVNELRTVLASAGISLESFDVDMNSNFKQSMADAKNQSNASGDKKQDKKNGAQAILSQNEMGDVDQDILSSMQNTSLHYVA